MKIDYFKILQDSAKFTWKYKILWIFGFLLAMFNGSGGSSSSNSYSDIGDSTQVPDSVKQIGDKIEEFFSSPYIWLYVIAGVFILLAIIVVSWYLSRISKTAIIKAVELDKGRKEKEIKFKSLFKTSNKYILKLLTLDFYGFLIGVPVLLLIVLSFLAVGFFKWFGMVIVCPSIIVIFLGFVAAGAIWNVAERLIILEDMGAKGSLVMAWNVLKRYYKQYMLAWLTSIIPGCLFSMVSGFLAVITLIPVAVIFIASLVSTSFTVIGLILSGCSCCAVSIFLKALEAPFQVFKVTYWTKFLMKLKDMSFGKRFAVEAEVVKK